MRYRMLHLARLFSAGLMALLAAPTALAQPQAKHTSYGLIVCESPNGRESFCPAETRYGVRLTEELSRGRCAQGRTWGTRADGIWVSGGCAGKFEIGSQSPAHPGDGYGDHDGGGQPGYADSVVCESIDSRYARCAADTRGGVELIRQLSRGVCVAGRTWGYDNGFIWVDRGCRGEFQTGGSGYGPPGYGQPGYGEPDWGLEDEYLIRCESIDLRQAFCPFDIGRGRVELERQVSRTRCTLGSNWNFNPRGIYVSGGCRGEFRVDPGYRPPGGGYGGYNVLRCESIDGRRRVCSADIRYGARLDRQVSKSPCQEGVSWGWDRRGVWVDRGCRGDFVID